MSEQSASSSQSAATSKPSTPATSAQSATVQAVSSAQQASQHVGSIVLRAAEGVLQDTPLSGITVRVQRVAPCVPENGYLPATDAFVDTFETLTDVNGNAYFEGIPLGCYYVSADVPNGYTMLQFSVGNAAFLYPADPHVEALLTFTANNPAPEPEGQECDPSTFEKLPYYPNGAVVFYCDGAWAQVNGPGDSARILQNLEGTWVSYVGLPTGECQTKAVSDGVSEALLTSFNPNC